MKIIDLLNKIANGEEVPKKVKYKTHYWEYREEEKDYKDNEDDYVFGCSNYDIPEMLNNEVEILEEEKEIPEKLERLEYSTNFNKEEFILYKNILAVNSNLNDVIDYLKSKGDE